MTYAAAERATTPQFGIFSARIVVALVQAVGLYVVTRGADVPYSWPATVPSLFEPLLLAFLFAPLVLMIGLGHIGARPLAIWTATAALVVAALGVFEAANNPTPQYFSPGALWPSFKLLCALIAGLFIAHTLVVDAVSERRIAPSYTRHFDTAWKQGVQIALTVVFVGVFWTVLWLGAALFKLVGLNFFQKLIEHRWFWIPATTLAVAAAFHATDVQPLLIRGARTMALTLLSWLLPLLAAILAVFLCCLPFTSLDALWSTRLATRLLLSSAALLIFLINTEYQDGGSTQTRSKIKRFAATLGAVELLPVVALAIWALGLRVAQYGWTSDRIFAAALLTISACYAIGYAIAVVQSPTWLKRLETTNVATSYIALAMIVALFSPIADPARLTVQSQVARLKSGVARPEKFDFVALKFDGARWGAAALAELAATKDGPDAAAISERAKRALDMTTRWAEAPNPPNGLELTLDEKIARMDVYPAGRTLPQYFFDETSMQQDGNSLIFCFREGARRCAAWFFSLRPGVEGILIYTGGAGVVFEPGTAERWAKIAMLHGPVHCLEPRSGVDRGEVATQLHAMPDLVIGGRRFDLIAPRAPALDCAR